MPSDSSAESSTLRSAIPNHGSPASSSSQEYTGPFIVDSASWTPLPDPGKFEVFVGISPYNPRLQSHVWSVLLRAPVSASRSYHLSSGPIDGLGHGYRRQINKSMYFPAADPFSIRVDQYQRIIPCGVLPSQYLNHFEALFLCTVPSGPNNFFILRFMRALVLFGMLEGFAEGLMMLHMHRPTYNAADLEWSGRGWTVDDAFYVWHFEEYSRTLVWDWNSTPEAHE
ncbi:uncharacterized protein BDV17DRAFT_176124 [Aspergillus undulatus]|uniref:uncharacterized protein n=1 Tax=Aspergillus undulatus TaxID=1810928 RepID=UPI003CCE45C3